MKQFTGQLVEQVFLHAAEKGLSNLDMSAVIQPLEVECGVVVKKQELNK